MENNYAEEALSHYDISKSEVKLIRHNENMTFRVGEGYLLQIHIHADGFRTGHIYEGFDRLKLYETELEFLAHLKKQGMTIREPIHNRDGRLITHLENGVTATVSKWLEGESLDKLEITDDLCRRIGILTAQLHKCARDFHAPTAICYDEHHCTRLREKIRTFEESGLSPAHSKILQAACDAVGTSLQKVKHEFQFLHADLSPSNILATPAGLAAIDFSFFGMGHPMYDLAILFGNINGLASRRKIAEGYREAGGEFNFPALDACFVLSILDGFAIHFEKWSQQDWFESRLNRWCKQSLEPFSAGERLFREDFYLIHAN